jgi:hypothetical protein
MCGDMLRHIFCARFLNHAAVLLDLGSRELQVALPFQVRLGEQNILGDRLPVRIN